MTHSDTELLSFLFHRCVTLLSSSLMLLLSLWLSQMNAYMSQCTFCYVFTALMVFTARLGFTQNSSLTFCRPLRSSLIMDVWFRLLSYTHLSAVIRPFLPPWLMTDTWRSVCLCSTTQSWQTEGFTHWCAWLTPFCIFSINIVLTARLRFCRTNIQRLFCLNWVIVKLACPGSNTVINNVYALATLSIYVVHWLFVVWTYMYIVKTCVQSKEDRAKFIQTCVPHLISLIMLFVIVVSDLMHMRFTSSDLPLSFQNLSSLAVVLIPPLMNPLLYGFKLAMIRKRIFVLLFLRKKLPVSS